MDWVHLPLEITLNSLGKKLLASFRLSDRKFWVFDVDAFYCKVASNYYKYLLVRAASTIPALSNPEIFLYSLAFILEVHFIALYRDLQYF